ncbi:MAG: SHOCT domain-containing protein [Gammaproteobacteria bacterium]|nr:SHOCT domain-containing protein [Gammaproteobacteria bacterium]
MLDHMGNFGWSMGFGWFFMLLFWGFIILGIAALVKWLWRLNGNGAKPTTALDLLQKRYARGEIDCEEYERIKRDFQS